MTESIPNDYFDKQLNKTLKNDFKVSPIEKAVMWLKTVKYPQGSINTATRTPSTGASCTLNSALGIGPFVQLPKYVIDNANQLIQMVRNGDI